jgi:multiple sugar transport system permease protein
VPLRLPDRLFLAVLLNEATRGWLFSHGFLPANDYSSVAAAVLWQWILNPFLWPDYGLLKRLGVRGQIGWPPQYRPMVTDYLSSWGVGGEMLIFLAGLKGLITAVMNRLNWVAPGAFSAFSASRCRCSARPCFLTL